MCIATNNNNKKFKVSLDAYYEYRNVNQKAENLWEYAGRPK